VGWDCPAARRETTGRALNREWESDSELPRFVALLRMATGPVERGAEHCGQPMGIEELEELSESQFFDASVKARCILSCRECGHIAWGWFD
jgi:hypothetical protein